MKKLLVFALAGLALFACKKSDSGKDPDPTGDVTIALDKDRASVKVGETVTITATVTPAGTAVTWVSSNTAIATVANGVVTGVAEGNAIITATAGNQNARCIVNVTKDGASGDVPVMKGSKVWPLILDGTTADALGNKMGYDYRPDDINKYLYIWEGTYEGGGASGKNFYQTASGDGAFTSLAVTDKGWAGAGFCMTSGNGVKPNAELFASMKELAEAIVANPNDYFLHIAIKATDNYSHCFYFFGSEETKFVLGGKSVYDGPVLSDFKRDGSWAEFDIPMSNYTVAMAGVVEKNVYDGMNLFVILSEGTQGALLNLDAVYFYKK